MVALYGGSKGRHGPTVRARGKPREGAERGWSLWSGLGAGAASRSRRAWCGSASSSRCWPARDRTSSLRRPPRKRRRKSGRAAPPTAKKTSPARSPAASPPTRTAATSSSLTRPTSASSSSRREGISSGLGAGTWSPAVLTTPARALRSAFPATATAVKRELKAPAPGSLASSARRASRSTAPATSTSSTSRTAGWRNSTPTATSC